LLFNLYVTFSKQDKLEKAEASLDRVVEKISEAGDSGEARYVLTEPRGWRLLFYEGGEPGACLGQRCLCICEEEGRFFGANQVEKCGNVGVCGIIEDSVTIKERIIIGPSEIVLKNEEGGISISEYE